MLIIILPWPSMKTFNRYTGLCSNASTELSRKMSDTIANTGCPPAASQKGCWSPEHHIYISVWISNKSWCLSKGFMSYVWTADRLGPHMAFVLWPLLISTYNNGSRHLNSNVTSLQLISVLSSKELLTVLMTSESVFSLMRFRIFKDILYCHCNIGSIISSTYLITLKR